ncbi:MAG: hypothetical protein ABI175_09955, partial [Polyangiales bacterium]
MSSRLAGAILALTAAALLALSLVTSAWWAGHPEVDGRTIELKTVHVGLHGAEGCNTGGDGGCTSLAMPGGFQLTGYIGLAVVGLLTLAALFLGISTLRGAEGRKLLAKIVMGLMAGAALVAIALIVQGPKMSGSARQISIPIGYGMFVFWIGGVVSIVGAVLAMRPLPKPELRPSRAAIAPGLAPPPSQSQPLDMMALLQQDSPRPASLGPEPMMGRAVAPPAGAGLAGPAGPLGVGSGQPAPLFNSAPQLRPLYDADPNMGGSSGYVPQPQPQLPMHAPAPVPRAHVAAMAGIPTPASIAAQEPPRSTTSIGPAVSMPPPPPRVPTMPPPRPGSPSVPPVPLLQPPRSVSPTAPPVPPVPPAPNRTRPLSVPPPPGAISARLKASSVPPPIRPGAPMPVPSTPRTLAGAMVPPPASYKLPVRAVTDPGDLGETVDLDAMRTLDRGHDAAVQVGRPSTNGEVGDSTDASVSLPEAESTDVHAPLDTEEAPIVQPPTESEEAETNAIEKQTLDVDSGVQDKSEPEPVAAVAAAPAEPVAAEAPKIPISAQARRGVDCLSQRGGGGLYLVGPHQEHR